MQDCAFFGEWREIKIKIVLSEFANYSDHHGEAHLSN